MEILVIFKIRAGRIPIKQVGKLVRMLEQILWHVGIAIDAIVDFGRPIVRVLPLANALQDLGRVGEVGQVEFRMGKRGDLVDHVLQTAQTRTAVPSRVVDFGIVFRHAQVFRAHGFPGPLIKSGLGVDPLFFAQGPLKAVSIVDRSQPQAEGELAVAQRFDDLRPGDFVRVGHDDDVAQLDFLIAFQFGEDLIHHGVAREMLPCPWVAGVVGAGHVENVMDHLVVKGGEAGPIVLDIQGFRSIVEINGGFQDDEVVDFGCQFAHADLGPVEFGVDHEEIVDFPLSIPVGIWFPMTHGTIIGGLCQGK